MPRASKDLFDDSTMSFGEHLEVLRIHLWKAVIGLTIGVVVALFIGDSIIAVVRGPIDKALAEYGRGVMVTDDTQGMEDINLWERIKSYLVDQFSLEVLWPAESPVAEPEPAADATSEVHAGTIRVEMQAFELGNALHELDPEAYPAPPQAAQERTLALHLTAPEFLEFRSAVERSRQAVTLNVQEAFVTYLKVSMIAGLVLSSPWVFYQLWMFVAAGLFPHERKFVYLYGTMSCGLFLLGVVFCFYLVFPFVLRFLLGFNVMLQLQPQIRLSEWISFAVTLPLLFGVSFQLPLAMLFLERIGVFEVETYQEQRRMAILVISIISMMLTPADPVSMLMMMFPLLILYELGVWLCRLSPPKSPFATEVT
jgi:sec-independent protein translocase protein TatC